MSAVFDLFRLYTPVLRNEPRRILRERLHVQQPEFNRYFLQFEDKIEVQILTKIPITIFPKGESINIPYGINTQTGEPLTYAHDLKPLAYGIASHDVFINIASGFSRTQEEASPKFQDIGLFSMGKFSRLEQGILQAHALELVKDAIDDTDYRVVALDYVKYLYQNRELNVYSQKLLDAIGEIKEEKVPALKLVE